MNDFKYLISFRVCLLTLALTSSCDIKSSADKTKAYVDTKAYQQTGWDSVPKPIGYVSDFEDIYTNNEEQILDDLIRDFERRTTIQIAVISIDTSMTTADSFDAFTLQIAKAWGVGQKGKDNGVLIGISSAYRRIRIQNGYSIGQILTDDETRQIIDTAFIPDFRVANYFEGTYGGLFALMKALEK